MPISKSHIPTATIIAIGNPSESPARKYIPIMMETIPSINLQLLLPSLFSDR